MSIPIFLMILQSLLLTHLLYVQVSFLISMGETGFIPNFGKVSFLFLQYI